MTSTSIAPTAPISPVEGRGSPGENLGAMHRIDAENGWAADENSLVLMVTHDAGNSWADATPPRTAAFQEIDFFDARNGWILDPGADLNVPGGRLWHTIDGGSSWSSIPLPYGRGAAGNAITFISPTTGFLLAGSAMAQFHPDATQRRDDPMWGFYRTVDAGKTWSQVAVPSLPKDVPGSLPAPVIAFTDDSNGFMGTYSGAFVTHDGGATWKPVAMSDKAGARRYFTAVDATAVGGRFFVDAWLDAGASSPGSGVVLMTSDDKGETWHICFTPSPGSTHVAWQAIDGGHWIDIGQGSVSATDDGGATWTSRTAGQIPDDRVISSISFVTPELGWAMLIHKSTCPATNACPIGDMSGVLAYTRDGGVTWHIMGER